MAASRRCAIHLLNETPEPCHESRGSSHRGEASTFILYTYYYTRITLYEILLVNKKT